MFKTFWETACQPNPGRFCPHSLPWMPSTIDLSLGNEAGDESLRGKGVQDLAMVPFAMPAA